jgi:uncharacterized protein (TIGR02246 family)
MRSKILFSVGLLATSPLWAAAQRATALSLREGVREIKSASRALADAQLRYDAPAVARLLAKDFVYVGNDGSVATKREFLPTVEDKKRQLLKLLEWELVQIRFYGDTAVALYFIHEKNAEKGKQHDFRGRSLATWVKQNGHWLCAAIHD